MRDRLKERISEIKRRIKKKRQKREDCITCAWAACSMFFMASICMIFSQVKMPGIGAVANGYGSVLLRDGASGYVVTAIVAFVIGVIVTVSGIWYRKKKQKQLQIEEGAEVYMEKEGEEI